MKSIKATILILALVALNACVRSNEDIKQAVSPVGQTDEYSNMVVTNFTSTQVSIQLQDDYANPIEGVKIQLWDKSPLEGGQVILKGITDAKGSFSETYNVPNHLNNVILETGYIGLPSFIVIPVDQLDAINITGFDQPFQLLDESLIPGQSSASDPTTTNFTSNGRTAATSVIEALGSYNSWGTPNYLLKRDIISTNLLDFVNASLPEGKPVPDYHPAFLSKGAQTNLNIVQTADIWMTFVSEGAGYKNSLGFYTYPTGNPPSSPSDIDTLHIGFPNASFWGSGGQLRSGDRIYLGRFKPGTTVGFALIADGFDTYKNSIKQNNRIHYSDVALNPEDDASKKQHTVLLWDDKNELFLIGFEDLLRTQDSDNDFNDVVFYITSNPVEAISRENVNPIDKPEDTDGDGVNDTYDEFPEDPKYAYRYSYPGENTYGTFAFEDQWPNFGDYDFNDLVVDYKYEQYANGSNKMVTLNSEFVLKATGAGFNNGFGVELGIAPDQISSVKGNELFGDVCTFNSNGTEAGQSKAVFIVTDNAHDSFGSNGLINTVQSSEYFIPDTIVVSVDFATPTSLDAAGSAPFNAFMIINGTRGREVHLPGYTPTDLVDTNYFGTANDGSEPQNGIYYKSKAGLPWAMNLPVAFDYPEEKVDIRSAYNHFDTWAKSGGFSYMDWYMDKSDYRNPDKIYTK